MEDKLYLALIDLQNTIIHTQDNTLKAMTMMSDELAKVQATVNDMKLELSELKSELVNNKEDLKQTKEELRAEFKSDLAQTKEELRAELKQTKEELRTELKQTKVELRSEFKSDLKQMKEEIMSDLGDFLRESFSSLYQKIDNVLQNHEERITRLEDYTPNDPKNISKVSENSDDVHYDA